MIEYLIPQYVRRLFRFGATRTELEDAEDDNVHHNLEAHSRAVDGLMNSVGRAKEVNENARETIRDVRRYIADGGVIDN